MPLFRRIRPQRSSVPTSSPDGPSERRGQAGPLVDSTAAAPAAPGTDGLVGDSSVVVGSVGQELPQLTRQVGALTDQVAELRLFVAELAAERQRLLEENLALRVEVASLTAGRAEPEAAVGDRELSPGGGPPEARRDGGAGDIGEPDGALTLLEGATVRCELAEERTNELEQPARDERCLAALDLEEPGLYTWQQEALDAWTCAGSSGVVEAVTGAGKTRLGVVASVRALCDGLNVLVVVPTLELQVQWTRVLTEFLPGVVIGRRGGGRQDSLGTHRVVVSTLHSAFEATARRTGDLIVVDECHRAAAPSLSIALDRAFKQRLGLTATFERADDAHTPFLVPYFGGVVYRLWYDRALADAVIAPFEVALVGVPLPAADQEAYTELSDAMASAMRQLRYRLGSHVELTHEAISRLAKAGESEGAGSARWYMSSWAKRRELLASTTAKRDALITLAPVVGSSDGTLVFTHTRQAALSAVELYAALGQRATAVHSGLTPGERRAAVDDFRTGALGVLAAPRVLDEGVDVPDADLGIVMAANRSRRQFVQRLGRVIRRKPDGRAGRFVVLFAEGTSEDPAQTGEDFLAECLPHARRSGVFHLPSDTDALLSFLRGSLAEAPPEGLSFELEREPVLVSPLSSDLTNQPLEHALRSPSATRRVDISSLVPGRLVEDADDAGDLVDELDEEVGDFDIRNALIRDAKRWPLLTAEEEVDLAVRIEVGLYCDWKLTAGSAMSPDETTELEWLAQDGRAAKERFICSNLRLAMNCAARAGGLEYLDRSQEAFVGLIRAVEKFDFYEGNKFSTYATWWIRQAMSRATADQGRVIRLPVHMVERVNAVRAAHRSLLRTGIPYPSDAQLAERLQTTTEDVESLLALARGIWSLDILIEHDLVEVIGGHPTAADVVEVEVEDGFRVAGVATALTLLSERDADMVARRFGLGEYDEQTLDEVGRAWGVTRERVRQVVNKRLPELRAGLVDWADDGLVVDRTA